VRARNGLPVGTEVMIESCCHGTNLSSVRQNPTSARSDTVVRMRIVNWNVNSIRARADRIGAWLDRSDADVLAIQELKCRDDQFPRELFDERGYDVAFHGLNQWNGVAIASGVGLEDVEIGFDEMPGFGEDMASEARAISAVTGGVRVYSLYVPNGRELDHPHYTYKLKWLEALRAVAA